ncbi:glycosyltransferase family 9 protein [Litoricolaceae bacterium]|nr:glycosyltransferase family 9 protein [Litorivicinaceae bacterium]
MRLLKAFLLKALTKKKRSAFVPVNPQSFVFLRYDRIGDLIVSLPLVKSLRESFPETKLILIGSQTNAPVAEYCELFDEIIVKPQGRPFKWISVLWDLRLRKVTITFDLNHSVTRHTLLACLAINPKHVATPYKDGRWGVRGTELEFFDIMPPQHQKEYARPMAELYLDIARILGCKTDNALPYPLSPRINYVDQNRTIILNHRGSRSSMRLRDEHLVEMAKIIRSIDPSYKITMFPEFSEHKHIQNLMRDQSNVDVMAPSSTIIPVIEAIKRASLVITPDTALTHIAAAFSKPLIAVYANEPALFKQWRPLNSAPTATIFSASKKSLNGYDFDQISQAIREFLKSRSD